MGLDNHLQRYSLPVMVKLCKTEIHPVDTCKTGFYSMVILAAM